MTSEVLPFDNGAILFAEKLNAALGYAGSHLQTNITVSATGSQYNFSNQPKFLIVKNIGSDICHLNTTTSAGSDDYGLPYGESIVYNCGYDGIESLYYFCDTGSDADLRLLWTY